MSPTFKDGRSDAITYLTLGAAALAMTGCKSAPKAAEKSDISSAVKATAPLAYYRLESTKGSSESGSTTYEFLGGATNSSPGAFAGVADNRFALLIGKDGWIKTTQMGGIDRAGSIMAWVDLAVLPTAKGRILYVAGESQSGNDFDLQFEPGNSLRFYTTGGGNLEYAPEPKTLVHQWHMIVATMDAAATNKALYWDGQPVAADQKPNSPKKTSQFTIGESPVFTGRFFDGGIDEVAIWDRALSAAEVASIYKAATTKP